MGMTTWQCVSSDLVTVLSCVAILWMYSDLPMPVRSEDTTRTLELYIYIYIYIYIYTYISHLSVLHIIQLHTTYLSRSMAEALSGIICELESPTLQMKWLFKYVW